MLISGKTEKERMPEDKDRENAYDGIRIVEDSEEEEVVRLDVPEAGTLTMREPSKEKMVMPNMMGETDLDEVPEILGPESEWLVAAEAKEVTIVPMGWFVLLFAGLGGVLIWAFFQGRGEVEGTVEAGPLPNTMIDQEAYDRLGQSVFRYDEAKLMEDAARDYNEMEVILRGFLSAKTVEERRKYVRHPDRVKPLMLDHYRRFPIQSYQYKEVSEYTTIPLKKKPFVALNVRVAEGKNFPILLENVEKGYLVDWESFVSYQPIAFEDYLKKRPTIPIDLRVYGSFDDFYAYEFPEEDGYLCVRMTAKHTDEVIFGYVKKGTTIASEMKKHLEAPPGRPRTQPFILRVRFLPESRAPRSVVIDKIVSTFWAYPTNPDQE